ncbi:unnamed protein product [Fusarium venenatum]|uniref:ZZ-type domain-containing protein n=1 Tax=Fusarium venenatum TaxID=56646 RepID=A0A2L2TKN5_9HYPO|nr:uncharacterized protein FVRRES_00198 [Fusarium venenatum]CEI63686.1 unnamed protein product [Fusarium venenatum]
MEMPSIRHEKQSDPAVESPEGLLTDNALDEDTHLLQKSPDETEGLDDDLISIQTETDVLLPVDIDSKIPLQEHKLGLDINAIRGWSGSEYDDYDVIAVHGIRDDYKTAWIDKNGGWILKDHLFNGMSIREIDYSYEIDESSVLYHQNGIDILAERLVDMYAKERESLAETETDRPVIWACHDIGGTIVKQVFIGTPHQFQSQDDAVDQIYKLVNLPGPDIKKQTFMKVKHLADQIARTNTRFVATKLLDRACIFNIISQSISDSLAGKADDNKFEGADGCNYEQDRTWSKTTVTPFHRYTHFIGHSFEASGRRRNNQINHLDLIRDEGCSLLNLFSDIFKMTGFVLKISYGLISLQTRLLALAPPTRALGIPFDPVLPYPPMLRWLHQQQPYISFKRQKSGANYLHIHSGGKSLVDSEDLSRRLYAHLDADLAHGNPTKTVVYFEFNQHDSRYRDLKSLLVYLINTMVWHFWPIIETLVSKELMFLVDTKSWTMEDLYHIFLKIRLSLLWRQDFTFFISCFDQCPEDQRRWFMDRILKEQSYSEASFRIIISTSTCDSLGIDDIAPDRHLNLLECPRFKEQPQDALSYESMKGLNNLVTRRPIYSRFLSRIKSLLEECNQVPKLAPLILGWLESNHRGKNGDEIAAVITSLSPATAGNIAHIFLRHLPPILHQKAKTAFTWIQHAAEPWSADALVEALALHASPDTELCLYDLDKETERDELIKEFNGIITVDNGDVKFCHPSFYQVTELMGGQGLEEFAARVNSSMATVCLRYFQLENSQSFLDELCLTKLADVPPEAPLEPFIIYHQRTSMSEYAVRFWADHYKASGSFKPKDLVRDIFGDKRYRARWEIPFWLMSNPFTRIGRHYISRLPVFAMLGLEDLIDDEIMADCDKRWFNKDCWFAIVEAIRWGNTRIATRLLGHAEVDEAELQVALLWAAARNDQGIIQDLLAKIPDIRRFEWPESLIYRSAAMGQDRLLSAMLTSGYDINKVGIYWDVPPAMIAAWRNQLSTLEILLKSEQKLDLSFIDSEGDTLLTVTTRGGNPDLLEVVMNAITGDAGIKVTKHTRNELVQAALWSCSQRALDLLLKSGIGYRGEGFQDPVTVTAADDGFLECLSAFLSHGFVPDAEDSAGTALYNAVSKGYVDIVRLLLNHDPKPKMDITPPGKDSILVNAICGGNVEIASLLIEHGATVDYIDENDTFNKTPLSRACAVGNLEMVKLLLKNKADINYTVDFSRSPLFSALYSWNFEVAKYLLANTKPDVTWKSSGDIGMLHMAYTDSEILRELLRRGAPIDGMSAGGTVLNLAAYIGALESIQILLSNDPKPEIDVKAPEDSVIEDNQGCTPLHSACRACSFGCVKALLAAGANPHAINKIGMDLVDILLRAPSESEDCEKCLRLLFSAPYNLPKERVDEGGRTRLHRIEKSTSVDFVRRLTSLVSEVDVKDKEGYTPLAVAASNGNTDVARYLIELGAKVNIFGSKYGSILHLAVNNGATDLVKLLISSGADPEMVDPQYGESLMYTALGITASGSRNSMVRFLADEVKVSIGKLGGELGYPVIRAAHLAFSPFTEVGDELLKFFIRRKARLDVTDSQGRSAVHFVSKSKFHDFFKILLRDKATINKADKFGRMPIHFAAANPDPTYLDYLLNTGKIVDIDVRDLDQWTPLMWAARSGSKSNIQRLLLEKADIWARNLSSNSQDGWSPLKLARFAGQTFDLSDLQPQEPSRVRQNGTVEIWNEDFHKSKAGDVKDSVFCDSCLTDIVGLRWTCMVCEESFDVCFKCFPHRSNFHDLEHNFESIGPLYHEDANDDMVTSHDPKEGVSNVDGEGLVLEEDNTNGINHLDSDSDS